MANGIDTKSIISQLMAVERIPQDLLRQRVTSLQTKQNAWNAIGSRLSALQTAADALSPVDSVSKLLTAKSSNDTAVGVRITGAADPSSSNIEVIDLATTHSAYGTDTFSDAASADGGRSITLTVGSGSPTTFTSANGTIGGLVDAINAGTTGVRAKLVQTSTGNYQVALTAAQSGSASAFTATGSGWTDPFTTATIGHDAHLKVDGIPISRGSNVIGDVITGVELTLKQPTTTAVQISVNRDDDGIVTKVKALVDAANGALSTIGAAAKSSATAASRGPLGGDSGAINLADTIRASIAGGVTGADGVVRPTSTVGISLTRDGSISFDESKLRAALANDPNTITSLIARSGTSSIPGVAVSSVLSTATPGVRTITVNQVASTSTMAGVPTPPPPAGSTINMTVTTPAGSFTVTFAAGASYAATAANLTAALSRSGLKIQASTDGSSFSLTEKRPGSANTFSVTDGGDLGLSGAATPGTDAVAVIDGTSVTGNGTSVFTGGTALNVGVTSAQLASAGGSISGTFTVADGLAGRLSRLASVGKTEGAVSAGNASLDSQIKDIQSRISRYDDTLAKRQATLTAKFTAMDTALTKLNGLLSQFGGTATTTSF